MFRPIFYTYLFCSWIVSTIIFFSQGDKASRAQILKKASEYIAFMRRKNSTHSNDIEDLKRQNQHLENQVCNKDV